VLASNPELLAALQQAMVEPTTTKGRRVSTRRLRQLLGCSPTDGAAQFDGEGKIRAVQCRDELLGDLGQELP
jgi:hypothetical protein